MLATPRQSSECFSLASCVLFYRLLYCKTLLYLREDDFLHLGRRGSLPERKPFDATVVGIWRACAARVCLNFVSTSSIKM